MQIRSDNSIAIGNKLSEKENISGTSKLQQHIYPQVTSLGTSYKFYLFNFDLHYFTGVTAFTHTLFTPHFSENVTLLRSFHTFGPEIALNPHGLTLSTGRRGFGAPEGRVQ